MIFRSKRKKTLTCASPEAPAGKRIYAIGDVHGRLDLLKILLSDIEMDQAGRSPASVEIIMLGDLIDRGPESAQVIDFLLNERPHFANFHFLMGNHEEAMLKSLAEGADPREVGWLSYGGHETLESYNIPDAVLEMRGYLLSDELRRLIPDTHVRFVAGFTDLLQFGDYVFVHAGIRPGVPLDRQKSKDLRWIRTEFLADERDHGCIVVHGHSIDLKPVFCSNRIGIDTGAYRSGVLTALALEGSERWILSTAAYAARAEGIATQTSRLLRMSTPISRDSILLQ